MMGKFYAVILLAMLISISCASTPVSFKEPDKTNNNSLKSIESMSFNNYADIEYIMDLGQVEAEASVTLIKDKNIITFKNKNFEMTSEDYGESFSYTDGSTCYAGSLSSILQSPVLSNEEMKMRLLELEYKAYSNDNKARSIVENEANYFLLEQAKKLGATAVMLPQYSWQVTRSAKITKDESFMAKINKRTEDVYSVKVFARAVTFKVPDIKASSSKTSEQKEGDARISESKSLEIIPINTRIQEKRKMRSK